VVLSIGWDAASMRNVIFAGIATGAAIGIGLALLLFG
jgi:hypothetical protein